MTALINLALVLGLPLLAMGLAIIIAPYFGAQ